MTVVVACLNWSMFMCSWHPSIQWSSVQMLVLNRLSLPMLLISFFLNSWTFSTRLYFYVWLCNFFTFFGAAVDVSLVVKLLLIFTKAPSWSAKLYCYQYKIKW